MKILSPIAAARMAVSANSTRPATAVIADTPDVRLIVFRVQPGQSVPAHRNPATVMLTVLEGSGFISGEADGASVESACARGDQIVYAPNEAHGMRADSEELLLLATITPRPGARAAQP